LPKLPSMEISSMIPVSISSEVLDT